MVTVFTGVFRRVVSGGCGRLSTTAVFAGQHLCGSPQRLRLSVPAGIHRYCLISWNGEGGRGGGWVVNIPPNRIQRETDIFDF